MHTVSIMACMGVLIQACTSAALLSAAMVYSAFSIRKTKHPRSNNQDTPFVKSGAANEED